jgi:hypothetical protein
MDIDNFMIQEAKKIIDFTQFMKFKIDGMVCIPNANQIF